MEILQTIWNSLINENETILVLTGIPMMLIEMALTFLLFTTILNITYKNKNAIFFILSNSLLGIATSYLIPTPYNTIINLLFFPVLVYFILKTNLLKAVLSEVVVYILLFIIGTPLVSIYANIFNVTTIQLSCIPLYKMLYSITLYVILYFIYKLLNKHNLHIKIFDRFDTFSYNILIINFVIGIFAIALQGYIEFLYIDYLPNNLIFLSLLILLTYFFISLYSLFRTGKLEQTEKELEKEKLYNKTLSTLHDNIRGFKHDFDNIVQAIGGYLSSNNIDGLKTYYQDVLGDCQINNTLAVLNPELINNPAVYSLLVDKYYKAEKLGIKMNIEVMMDLSNLNIKIYELSRILGVLLDNALEAASKCDKKVVNITFRKDKNANKDLIIIQNTYNNKNIDINRIFEKGFSSKKDDKEHGLGLWEVRKYLSKNTDLDLFTTKTDELFSQQFEIYN